MSLHGQTFRYGSFFCMKLDKIEHFALNAKKIVTVINLNWGQYEKNVCV